ncbi:MAG: D-alanyl-D-alanine carboxypeptidase/D-alanyl-D-alanine endopeptidase [Candidatus Loosdrechtia sp.]|uniref:D-alanyl-D-alanine carboxypeptidase/D-alanyl-D-alanine-endopeptidase n=1 Tax=Candidatus Loosdrechtia sp. TaxID=3101272 RepID=UPI003A60B4D6|nr:MAG: D-alanyl-D-alanine carboxypeptidase/D-alanyl-D-alanine-endopeptidase [Candidatus Jettenia sp. AMX2]
MLHPLRGENLPGRSCATLWIIVFITLSYSLFARPLYADIVRPNKLYDRIESVLAHPSLKNASYGIHVVSMKDNISLFDYRSDDLFRVASNMKLLTTAAALEYLGPDFEYRTSIETNGKITDSGKLKGDVIIRGSGDPNISGRFYNGNLTAVPESWAMAMKSRGIDKITGDIVADDSVFDRVYIKPGWPKNQLSEWYCAPVSGLSFNDNCVDITLLPGRNPGRRVSFLLEPDTSYVTITNTCVYTSHKKEHAYSIYREQGTNRIFIRGKFWINASPGKKWVSVHEPPLYLATVFKEVLKKNGITVQGKARLIHANDSTGSSSGEKITHTTSTMGQSILVTNKRSQNFYAEQILKTLGSQIRGSGDAASGIEVIHIFMNRKLGVPQDAYQIEDGSGLSRGNRLSPGMITSLLAYMMKHPHGEVFFDSLPVSGVDGGLRRRMVSAPYKNNVYAKTGYIAGTSALSGYINTTGKGLLAFSILINDFHNLSAVRKIQDDICQALIDYYNVNL